MVLRLSGLLRGCGLLPFVCLIMLLGPLSGYCQLEEDSMAAQQRTRRAWLMNLVAVGGVTAWGVANWDYFSQKPRTTSERWFGHDTKEGGADKLGHLWSSYALSHGFAAMYQRIGYPARDANCYGPLSALAITGLMEVGDSFSSDYGFSAEDMVSNLAGVAIGWVLLEYPDWRDKIDLRWEYCPDIYDLEADIVTDYEHSKYLVAIKAVGFKQIKQPWLQALELHLGYYSRHYDGYAEGRTDRRRRYLYAGLGVNVSYLLKPMWDSRLFNYLQLPYSYLEWDGRH